MFFAQVGICLVPRHVSPAVGLAPPPWCSSQRSCRGRGADTCGIVAGCRNGALVIWRVDPDDLTGKPVRLGASIAAGVTALACSPGGRRNDGLCEVLRDAAARA